MKLREDREPHRRQKSEHTVMRQRANKRQVVESLIERDRWVEREHAQRSDHEQTRDDMRCRWPRDSPSAHRPTGDGDDRERDQWKSPKVSDSGEEKADMRAKREPEGGAQRQSLAHTNRERSRSRGRDQQQRQDGRVPCEEEKHALRMMRETRREKGRGLKDEG
jgi:hypothetical protein